MTSILVIDDSEFDRRMITRALKNADETIDFSELESGKAVIDVIRQSRPDLILLDIRMPGPDGFEVLDMIKGHHRFKACKVVMISGSEASCDKDMAKDKGAIAYFAKPNTNAGYAELAKQLNQNYLGAAA